MDTLLHLIEMAHPEWIPYISLGIAVASVVAVFLPPPDAGSPRAYGALYRVIQTIALNVGHAKNATDPQVAGLAPDQPTANVG